MRSIAIAALAGVSMAYDHWAVLVAGSNTYWNYRHQADVHHAYQILKANGMPESNIILMSYDDIAQSSYNPFPGQVFNKPNGENVYFQEDITYSGADVTAEKFLAVLKGDAATAGGKVLESTENSKVFVYFADHGAPGFVCMPSGPYLYADQIQEALTYMQQNNMYKELTFYVEACESGSMFPDLTASQNVFAMTAANASESSWGTYCGSDAMVQGKNIGSCLGDLFSVNWMEDTEANNYKTETLDTQYKNVLAATTKSHVQKFGDFDFMDEPVGDFEGNLDMFLSEKKEKKHHGFRKWAQKVGEQFKQVPTMIKRQISKVESESKTSYDSRDIKMHNLFERYAKSGAAEDLAELKKELAHREKAEAFFKQITTGLELESNDELKVQDYDCYRFLVNTYEKTCEKFSDYSLKYAKVLARVCETGNPDAAANAVRIMQATC